MSSSRPMLLLAFALAAPPVALADFVVFSDGRYLAVTEYRFGEQDTWVRLPNGGEMSFTNSAVKLVVPDEDVMTARAPEPLGAGEGWLAFTDPRFQDSIARVSSRHSLEPALIAAVVKVESNFLPHAVSPKGALGLMQLMPQTAKEQKVSDPFDVESNLDGGTRYLSWLLERYDNNLELALAAYNAGPGAVDRAKGIPPYRETRSYVRRVLELARLDLPAAVGSD